MQKGYRKFWNEREPELKGMIIVQGGLEDQEGKGL